MASASCGRSLLNSCRKASKRACCCKLLMPGGRVVSVLRVRCMRSRRPFCCGWPGLMRSMAMPRRSHQTESLERLNRAFGLANGTPLSERIACGRPRSRKSCSKAVKAGASRTEVSASHIRRLARSMVGDGERVAILAIAELELALEVGAPQFVGCLALRQRCTSRPPSRPARDLDQAMPVEHGVNGAFGGNPKIPVQPPDQQLADLARPPMRLVALGVYDQLLDLHRQLVGVAHRPAGAVGQRLEPVLLVAVEDLVAGLARDAELAADLRHPFPIKKPCDKPQALVHDRTLLPRHQPLPPNEERCYPCVRYDLSPICRVAQRRSIDAGDEARGPGLVGGVFGESRC